MTDSPNQTTAPESEKSPTPRWFFPALLAALVILGGLIAYSIFADDEDGDTTEGTIVTTTVVEPTSTEATEQPDATTTTIEETTTSEEATTTEAPATTVVDPEVYATAVWPWVSSTVRYTDPVEAATGFAADFVGFVDPIAGEFQQGDSRSGEVEIRPLADGPVTTVFVRQLGPDDTWWVLGAATANIIVTQPEAFAEVGSPLTVAGEALAFEGVVNFQLRVDDTDERLIDNFVMGGGTELAPFEKTFEWEVPDDDYGALVFLTESAENGDVWEASVMRVGFADAG